MPLCLLTQNKVFMQINALESNLLKSLECVMWEGVSPCDFNNDNNNNNTTFSALYLFESIMCITLAEMIQIHLFVQD